MTQDFRHVDDLHDFIADLLHDTADQLDEGGIHEEITLSRRTIRGDFGIEFGLDTIIPYGQDDIPFLTADRIRSTVVRAAVTAARRQRRTRVIGHTGRYFFGLLPARPANPLWSCHADLLVVSAFLAKGHEASQVELLGPGRNEPDRSLDDAARNIHPHTLVDPYDSMGHGTFRRQNVRFHQHYVRDGIVHAHVSIDNDARSEDDSIYGPLEILSDHRSAVSIHGYDLPDTVLSALAGRTVDELLSHPVIARAPDLHILEAHSSEEGRQTIHATLERRRTFLAKAPEGTDLSFAELGNDLLAKVGETTVTVLPFSPDLHLASL